MSKKPNHLNQRTILPSFTKTAIRRTWDIEEWWFAIVDVVVVLSDSFSQTSMARIYDAVTNSELKGRGQMPPPSS